MENTEEQPLENQAPVEAQSAPRTKSPIVIFAVILLLVVGLLVYYFGLFKTSSSPAVTTTISPTVNPVTVSPDIKETLTALEKDLQVTAPITARKNVSWFTKKQIIPLTGQGFLLGTFANAYVGKYGNLGEGNLQAVTKVFLTPLITAAENSLIAQGFKKNNEAESTYYTKGDLICLVNATLQVDPFGDFFCGRVDEEQAAWRKELAPVINPTNDSDIVVSVDKLSGNFATGGIGAVRGGGGAVWYAVKVNGSWKKVFTGQNSISCNVVKQYSMPKEIYGECSTAY